MESGAKAVPYAHTIASGVSEDWTGAAYALTPAATEGGLWIVDNGVAKFAQLTITTSAAQGDAVTFSTGSGGLFEVTGGTTAATRSVLTTTGNGAVGVNVLNASQVTLTNTDIVTNGYSGAHGMAVTGGGGATLNNVTIETKYAGGTTSNSLGHNDGLLVTGGSTVDMTGGSIKTNGVFVAWGVEVMDAGTNVTLTDVAVTTTGTGGSGGIRLNNRQMNQTPAQTADPSGSGSLTMIRGSVTTSGTSADALFVQDYGTLKVDGTTVRATGDTASGFNIGSNANITITNADIKTTGASGYGLRTGSSAVDIFNTKIETGTNAIIGGKNNAAGVYITSTNALVTLDNTTISTNGKNSPGIWLNGSTPGTGKLKVTNSNITAKNSDSYGLAIYAGNADISGSTITAAGAKSGIDPAAVMATNSANVKLSDNTIKSTGSGAQGVVSTAGSTVNITGGSVATTGSGTAYALVVSGGSTLTANGTTVSATSTTAYGLSVAGASAAITNTATLTDTTLTAKAAAINVAGGTGNITLAGSGTNVTGNGTWLNVAASTIANVTAQTGAQVNGKVTTASGGTSNVAIDSGAAWNINGASNITDLSFDGGILRYMASGPSITNPNDITLKAGGATVDTNGFNNELPQVFIGSGGITKIGAGVLTLLAENTYTGLTDVREGTLLVGNLATPTSSVAGPGLVGANGILSGTGTVVGSVTNNGTIAALNALVGHESDPITNLTVGGLANNGTIQLAGGTVGNTLTVAGNYTGGGTMVINTVLGDSSSLTDKLIVSGGTATGTTMVSVINAGGPGDETTGDGIKVVDAINGTSTAGARFTLSSRVAAGAYEYSLARGYNDNQSWFLRNVIAVPLPNTGADPSPDPTPDPVSDPSPEPQPTTPAVQTLPDYRVEVPVYMTAPALASRLGLAMLGTYHDRNGEDYIQPLAPVYEERVVTGRDGKRRTIRVATDAQPDRYVHAGWARLFGGAGSVGYGGKGTLQGRLGTFMKNGPSYNYDLAGFQAGLDVYRRESPKGTSDIAGVSVGAGRIDSDVRGVYGGKAGSMAMDGYTFGGYWTRKSVSGWYIDAVAQATLFEDVQGRSVKGQRMDTQGWGFTGSLEGGYPIPLAEGFKLEPQLQLIYQHISLDNGRDAYGRVSYGDTDTLYGRIGARLTKDVALADNRMLTLWLRANLWHAFGGNARTTFTNVYGFNPSTFRTNLGGTWAQFGFGISGRVAQNVNLFVSGDYEMNAGKARGHGLSGRLGVRVIW